MHVNYLVNVRGKRKRCGKTELASKNCHEYLQIFNFNLFVYPACVILSR